MTPRHMQRTRLEDTRLWLAQRLDELADDAAHERDLARCRENAKPEHLEEALTYVEGNRVGKTQAYTQLREFLLAETEQTFTFGRLLQLVENLNATVYQSDEPFPVLSGRANGYQWFCSHLRDRIEMTIPGRMCIKFDLTPRRREWKNGRFAACASQIAA